MSQTRLEWADQLPPAEKALNVDTNTLQSWILNFKGTINDEK